MAEETFIQLNPDQPDRSSPISHDDIVNLKIFINTQLDKPITKKDLSSRLAYIKKRLAHLEKSQKNSCTSLDPLDYGAGLRCAGCNFLHHCKLNFPCLECRQGDKNTSLINSKGHNHE